MCTENNSTDLKICMHSGIYFRTRKSEDSSNREVCKLPIEKYHSLAKTHMKFEY